MKIALLTSTFLPRIGGAEIVVHNLAQQFRAMGHDARVVTWWGLWKGIRGNVPYPVIPLLPASFTLKDRARWEEGRGTTAFVGTQLRLLQAIHRFDVWNIHMAYPMGVLAVDALKSSGCAVVTTCHGDDLFVYPEIGYNFRANSNVDRAIRGALHHSDIVTAISKSVREEYLKAGVREDRIRDIPNGVDLERITHASRTRDDVREGLGVARDTTLILSVGRNHPQKGYRFIPDIAADLKGRGLRFVWLVVGAGTDVVAKEAADKGVGDCVRALPAFGVDNAGYALPPQALVDIYRASDVFAMPSLLEALPVVLIEALAAGLPLVASNVPGCRDLVRDGENGLLVEAAVPSAFAAALARVASDADLRNTLRTGGGRDAARFRWDHVSAGYVSAYREAALSGVSGRTNV